MSLNLPAPIAAYLAVENGADVDALAQCFAANATVQDEGRTITGIAAIQQWKTETKQKYHHTVEPLSCVRKDGKIVLTARLVGSFPGSPVDLQFIFVLSGERIVSLEIHS